MARSFAKSSVELTFNGLKTARQKIVAMKQRFDPSFGGQKPLPLMIKDERKRLDIMERARPNNFCDTACRPLDAGRVSTIGLIRCNGLRRCSRNVCSLYA